MTPYRFSLGSGFRGGLGLAPGQDQLLLFSLENEEKIGQFSQQDLYKGL